MAVSDGVVAGETLVGRRLLCESCMRRETLVDVGQFVELTAVDVRASV